MTKIDTTGAIHKALKGYENLLDVGRLHGDDIATAKDIIATLQAVLEEVPDLKLSIEIYGKYGQFDKATKGVIDCIKAAKLLHKITQKEVSDG